MVHWQLPESCEGQAQTFLSVSHAAYEGKMAQRGLVWHLFDGEDGVAEWSVFKDALFYDALRSPDFLEHHPFVAVGSLVISQSQLDGEGSQWRNSASVKKCTRA